MKNTSAEMQRLEKRKRFIALLISLGTAASPGIYSAWQSAKNAYHQDVEQKTRDTQETDLQKSVKGNASAIDALEKTCVTHKDLLTVALQLQQIHKKPQGSRRVEREELQRQRIELSQKLDVLQRRVRIENVAKQKLKAVKLARPKLRSADTVRQMIQQKAE